MSWYDIEILGYIGSFLFAFCALPQAWKSHKEGHSEGVSNILLWMWLGGEITMTAYLLLKNGTDIPVTLNAVMNIVFIFIIMKYKYKPRIGK